MTRIFLGLAALAVLMLAGNLALGLSIGDYNGAFDAVSRAEQQRQNAPPEEKEAKVDEIRRIITENAAVFKRKELHFLFGVVASLMTVLVNCITVTYFIGTSRWVREVADAYQLPLDFAQRSDTLKRASFPWAVTGVLTIIGIVALGAASDPTTGLASTAWWVNFHLAAAFGGTALIAWAFLKQIEKIGQNYEVIDEVLVEVRRIRAERGLDKDDDAEETGVDSAESAAVEQPATA